MDLEVGDRRRAAERQADHPAQAAQADPGPPHDPGRAGLGMVNPGQVLGCTSTRSSGPATASASWIVATWLFGSPVHGHLGGGGEGEGEESRDGVGQSHGGGEGIDGDPEFGP